MDARGADQVERLLFVRLADAIEKQILALQRATDGDVQRALQWFGKAKQQRVRQVDDVETRLRLQPVKQLDDLFPLEAAIALQHRNGQLAKALGIDLDLPFRRHLDHPLGIPEAIEHAWCMAKECGVLFEKNADAAEEDVILADVALVRSRRRIDRRQHHVVPARQQLSRKRVVAQATAAIHRPRTARK